jgi:hypothetical protein
MKRIAFTGHRDSVTVESELDESVSGYSQVFRRTSSDCNLIVKIF